MQNMPSHVCTQESGSIRQPYAVRKKHPEFPSPNPLVFFLVTCMHKTLLYHFLINGIIVDLVLHTGDYHLQWLCVHSLCYQKIKWILRRRCFTVRFDFPPHERFLNYRGADNTWQRENQREESREQGFTCLVKLLTLAEGRGSYRWEHMGWIMGRVRASSLA